LNIFVLDRDTKLCAQYHNDKHTVKMILETTQLLNNALIKNVPGYDPVYRKTHFNHPCSIWTSKNITNFKWLLSLGIELCHEYSFRYDKIHKCEAHIRRFSEMELGAFPDDDGDIKFVQCMPDEYKKDDPVEGYRAYYLGNKAHIASWKRRDPPFWWVGGI